MGTIVNGKDRPINFQAGSVPNMGGALLDWFQNITFTLVSKSVSGFRVIEVGSSVSFFGVVQPLSGRALQIKPEGERYWNWISVHSQICLPLNVDDVITYQGIQYRVMNQKDFSLYSYYYYELVEDYTGSGPS